MKFTRPLVLIAMVFALTGGASAQTLFEKISKGAKKVGETVENGANVVGDEIDSTLDLATNEDTPAATRAKLDQMAEKTLTRFFSETPEAMDLYLASAGYAVFDTRKVSVFPVSGGFGRGVAVAKDGSTRTYMNMGSGGVGLSFGTGGFNTQLVLLFETPATFEDFVVNGYDASAEAGTVMGDEDGEATFRFIDGRSTFVLTKKRWRVTANTAGAKFWAAPDLN